MRSNENITICKTHVTLMFSPLPRRPHSGPVDCADESSDDDEDADDDDDGEVIDDEDDDKADDKKVKTVKQNVTEWSHLNDNKV
jgi:hypothetical protein